MPDGPGMRIRLVDTTLPERGSVMAKVVEKIKEELLKMVQPTIFFFGPLPLSPA
jgi:hypothetical protein